MAKASLHTWAIAQLMKLFEPFLMLLKPLEPFFTIIGGLLKTLFGPIITEIMEKMQPFYDLLMDLAEPLGDLGQTIADMITPIFDLVGDLVDLEDIADKVSTAIEIVVGWLDDFEKWLGGFLPEDVSKKKKKKAEAARAGGILMGPVGAVLGALFGGGQRGIEYIPETGPYLLHKGERVTPARETSEMMYDMKEMLYYQREMYRMKKMGKFRI